jgi:hypothetical protein
MSGFLKAVPHLLSPTARLKPAPSQPQKPQPAPTESTLPALRLNPAATRQCRPDRSPPPSACLSGLGPVLGRACACDSSAGAGRGPVHPLYDVALIASSGNTWTLAGFERVEAGPLRALHVLGQSWLIEPVAMQELIEVERKWSAAAGRVHDLEQQLIAPGLAPVPPKAGVAFT